MTHGQRQFSIAFMTLGCKVNYYETEKLAARFSEAGAKVVPFEEYADVYVVNTCTVTNIADRKSRKMLHRAARINSNAIVAALGCFAEAQGDKLALDESIDVVIGNGDKDKAFGIIMDAIRERLSDIGDINTLIEELPDIQAGSKDEFPLVFQKDASINSCVKHHKPEERTRAYVKIQDGCNQFCSYCKIPYVRGRLRSRDEADVQAEIQELAECGYREVVLTGIHLSSYGVDKCDCKSFVELQGNPLYELIRGISGISGIERIRLGSLEPRIITEEFAMKLSGIDKLCPHFHLSMQSGCDATLARMNRKYTAEDFTKACNILRSHFDNPAITTDVIVGFPGETDEEFGISRQYIEDTAFSAIHVFKYSKRDGTRASVMPEQVNEQVKNERSRQLIETGRVISRKYADIYIGSVQKCLVEEVVLINGSKFWMGHNERYLKLVFKYDDTNGDINNSIIDVIPENYLETGVLMCRAKNTLLN